MKSKIIYIVFLLGIIFCKSQIISLDQLSQCENGNCPNYTSVKDTNNRLDKFVGIWKGTYSNGRIYEFHFSKKNDFILYNGKPRDMIIGRMLVKMNDGTELENTINSIDSETHFNGLEFYKDLVRYQMYYSGNAECNDKGYVYLSFPDPNNLSQLKLVFVQDNDIIASCPNTYQTVMPNAKALILTKQ